MTLKELLKDKELGTVKVRHFLWEESKWFQPMYYHNELVFGHDDDDFPDSQEIDYDTDWELFEEPKTKVMRAQYLYKLRNFRPMITQELFLCDSEFERTIERQDKLEWYKRLDEIECES